MCKNFRIAIWFGLLSLGALGKLEAQNIEISLNYGYQFGSKAKYPLGYVKVDDSDYYGIALGYGIANQFVLELSYARMGDELRIRDRDLGPREERLSDLTVSVIQIGTKRYFNQGMVQPYVGGGLGLMIFSPRNPNRDIVDFNLDNATHFALSIKAGILLNVSQSVGIKFQGDLFLPVDWGGIYVGIGPGGPSGGVGLGSTTIIPGLHGGLLLRL